MKNPRTKKFKSTNEKQKILTHEEQKVIQQHILSTAGERANMLRTQEHMMGPSNITPTKPMRKTWHGKPVVNK